MEGLAARLQSLLPAWSSTKWLLWGANALLVVALIVLGNLGVLPLDAPHFIFFFCVALLFALYRPGWAFLFLVGVLPLETVNVAPLDWGLDLRPYQAIGALLIVALGIRSFIGKFPFPLVRLRSWDWALLLLPLGAVTGALAASDHGLSLRLALVVASFVALYFVFRQYLQTQDDIGQTLPFFLSSAVIVMLYALWQNLREGAGQAAYNVMAGRPNATMSEADWLGMFMIFVLTVFWAGAFQKTKRELSWQNQWSDPARFFSWVVEVLAVIVLILTVSRSAWLGAFAALLVFLGAALRTRLAAPRPRFLASWTGGRLAAVVSALLIVTLFGLTPFALFDRALSTGTALQTITVACRGTEPPARISDLSELVGLGCEHILLEEKETRLQTGWVVGESTRPDPTIGERLRIYDRVQALINDHWLWGIGWGSIGVLLGSDDRGTVLNASNAWLEVWLGSGLVGLLGFLWITAVLVVASFQTVFSGQAGGWGLVILSGTIGLGVFNLFNSGVLLGFFFFFLALGACYAARVATAERTP